ncbi:hypothetical protein BMS3Bbin14_00239 [bacterium BMS3Bbin14]|nr:hypothetical protein BMS3Bbin14_00239 [bacterium BMS3Bbin14]HDH07419.1 hypothetical protein [Candidatus Moranbacteria bacterium]
MISERKFSNTFSSFWKQLFPMGEHFVRRLNLACERDAPPLESSMPVNRDKRAVINELAFRFFKEKACNNKVNKKRMNELSNEVISYIENLSFSIPKIYPLTQEELEESVALSNSLPSFFSATDLPSLEFWPSFRGCGSIHACKADIFYKDTLVEVKAGDRHFRINDIRQIITYLSLNFASHQYVINNIELINPRTGLYFQAPVKTIIEESSGKQPVDIFSDIVEFISNEIGSN